MNRYTVRVFEETFDPNDKEALFRIYSVPASTELDARLLAFVLDQGIELAKYNSGSVIDDGEVELAKTYTLVVENRKISRLGLQSPTAFGDTDV